MERSSPPDPHGLTENCPVGQCEHRAKTHFVADNGIWLKTQQVPQKTGSDVDELLIKDFSIQLFRVSDLPAPGTNNFRLWQCFLDLVPRVSVGLLPAMENKEVELVC